MSVGPRAILWALPWLLGLALGGPVRAEGPGRAADAQDRSAPVSLDDDPGKAGEEGPAPDEPASDGPASAGPASDEPASDEPAPDEPAPDESAPDEPTPDEPASDERAREEPGPTGARPPKAGPEEAPPVAAPPGEQGPLAPPLAGPRFHLEVVLHTTGRAASNGVGTEMLPVVGVRGGGLVPVYRLGPGALVVGGDGFLGAAQESHGTRWVRVARAWLGLEARGIAGWETGGRRFGFLPYAFVAAGAGGGLSTAKVIDQVRYGPFLIYQLRAGGGLRVRLFDVTLGLDLGAGLSSARVALSTTASLGWSW